MDAAELANSGDHAALNLLNTRCSPWGEPIDLLDSGRHLLDWLASTELIDQTERSLLSRTFTAGELDEVADQVRTLREWLRDVIASWADPAKPPSIPASVATRLNEILATGSQYLQLATDAEGKPELLVRQRWEQAEQLLTLPAAAAAELLAHGDRELVRVCDGPECALWFYDRTRSHHRRWCSTAVCGNRDKVRNHRQRTRRAVAAH